MLAAEQYSTLDRFLFLGFAALSFWFAIGMNILLGVMCLLGFIFGRDILK